MLDRFPAGIFPPLQIIKLSASTGFDFCNINSQSKETYFSNPHLTQKKPEMFCSPCAKEGGRELHQKENVSYSLIASGSMLAAS